MRLESIPVFSEEADECFLIRLNGEDIGNVESINIHVGDKVAWYFYSMDTEVSEGPFPTRRAAERALAQHHNPDYGTVDFDTSEDMREELIRLLAASQQRDDCDSMGQKNYRFGIATAYEAITRLLFDKPPLDAEFHANEVRVEGK
jgi:hypothetical protein